MELDHGWGSSELNRVTQITDAPLQYYSYENINAIMNMPRMTVQQIRGIELLKKYRTKVYNHLLKIEKKKSEEKYSVYV